VPAERGGAGKSNSLRKKDSGKVAMRIVIEPQIKPHDAVLYRASVVKPEINGFESIDAEALQRYENDGFLAIGGAFSPRLMEDAAAELVAMMHSDDPRCESVYFESTIRQHLAVDDGPARSQTEGIPQLPAAIRASLVRKFMAFTTTHEALAAMLTPALVDVVTRIIGEPITCFQEMALIKPPGGQEKPWHQDHAYFNLPLSTKVVGVWIALADVTPEMGCMHVVAGGHRTGPLPHFRIRDWQICDETVEGRSRLAIQMRAGDVLLFDSKLPHGTPTNHTAHQRFAVQFHFAPKAAVRTTDEDRMAVFGSEGKDVRC
jgi:phytanoyl-CoA hydroxylase